MEQFQSPLRLPNQLFSIATKQTTSPPQPMPAYTLLDFSSHSNSDKPGSRRRLSSASPPLHTSHRRAQIQIRARTCDPWQRLPQFRYLSCWLSYTHASTCPRGRKYCYAGAVSDDSEWPQHCSDCAVIVELSCRKQIAIQLLGKLQMFANSDAYA